MFIALEGIDGSGKTTAVHHTGNLLRANGHDPPRTVGRGDEVGKAVMTRRGK